MSDTSYSVMLRNLSREYYQSHIGFEEYRKQRKSILDKIDQDFNGYKSHDLQTEESEQLSHFMNTTVFFKGSDVDS